MVTYSTQNPLGSADPRDLYDNAQVIDDYANGDADTTQDRLGVTRKTLAGMENEFDQDQSDRASEYAADKTARDTTFDADQADREQRWNLLLANSGYEYLADYAAGIEVAEYNQVIRDTAGELWRASAGTELPYTTTGAGMPEGGAFVAIGDADIRNDLAAGVAIGQGALLVRGSVIYVDTIADLQALPVGELVDGQQASVAGSPFNWSGSEWVALGAVSVKAYGAKGDGITDDTDAIQAAMDSHSKVFIPDGVYMVRGIYPPSNIEIVFSKGAILRIIPRDLANYAVMRIVKKSNVTIIGAQVEGDRYDNASTTGEQGFGIRIQSSENIKVLGGYATGFWGDGIIISAWNPDGYVNGKNITIRDFESYDNRRQGLSIGGGENIWIENCIFRDTNGTAPEFGIDIEPDVDPASSVHNVTIRGCVITGNEGVGVAMLNLDTESPDAVKGVAIVDCLISGNVQGGVESIKGKQVSFTNSVIKDNQGHGCRFLLGAEVSFLKCIVSGNSGDGAHLLTGSLASMSECSIVGNLMRGVYFSRGKFAITNSEVAENGLVGVLAGDMIAGDRIAIRGCEIRDNGDSGIYLKSNAPLETPYRITDNFVYGNVTGSQETPRSNIETQASNGFILRNIVRAGGGTNVADRGLRVLAASDVSVIENDFRGGGSVTDYLVQSSTVIDRDNFPYKTSGPFSERPTTNLQSGMTYYDTDTNLLLYYTHSGQWKDGSGTIYPA